MPAAEQTTRMFLGIPLPTAFCNDLAAVAKDLKANGVEAGNWSHSDLYHVTLVFLGEIGQADEQKVSDLARETAAQHEHSSLTVTRIGMFPKSRILWAGIDETQERHFGRIAAQLADGVGANTQLAIESRPFRAHITLARKLQGPVDIAGQTEYLRQTGKLMGEMTTAICELALFSSKRVDGRLVYPIERRFSLS